MSEPAINQARHCLDVLDSFLDVELMREPGMKDKALAIIESHILASDSFKTKEINVLVQENRALHALTNINHEAEIIKLQGRVNDLRTVLLALVNYTVACEGMLNASAARQVENARAILSYPW